MPPMIDAYYTDGGDNAIRSMMEDAYKQSLSLNQSYWWQADIDLRFKAGDQNIWNEVYTDVPQKFRKSFNFNRILRMINMVTGYQRRNRKSLVVSPIENSDNYTADQLSKALFWATRRDNILETFSDAFEGAVTCGMNLISLYMDYRFDSVSGDICADNVAYSSYLLDPFFRKQNLSDCNFLWRRMWRSPTQTKMMFPGREADIDRVAHAPARDGRFNFMAESYEFKSNGLLAVDEFWYLTSRKQTFIEDVETGDSLEFFGDKAELKSFLAEHPEVVTKENFIPTVRLVYCVNNNVFYDGPNPYGHPLRPIDNYPFVPVFAYYEPNLPSYSDRIQGIVRGLRDAQFLYNRRKVIELDILESQVNSGFIYEESALIDQSDVFQTGQGKGIGVRDGRIGSVQRIEAAQVPPSMFQMSELMAREIMEISGINEELLGMAEGDMPGILAMIRQAASLVTMQKVFDQADSSLRLIGQRMTELIQANFSPAKIERITEMPVSPQFRDKSFLRYDICVEEGLNTSTQRQMQFAQMVDLYSKGVPIDPRDIFEASSLQNKSKIIENMEQREQADAEQKQQQLAMELEVLRAQIDDLRSRALANQGLGVERASRVAENESLATQREAEAVENVAMARLNKVKAMKELQDMDINHIKQLIEILQTLELGSEEGQVKNIDDSDKKDPLAILNTLQTNQSLSQ